MANWEVLPAIPGRTYESELMWICHILLFLKVYIPGRADLEEIIGREQWTQGNGTHDIVSVLYSSLPPCLAYCNA